MEKERRFNPWAIAAGCLWGIFAWIYVPPFLKAFSEYKQALLDDSARKLAQLNPNHCTEAAAHFQRPWSERKGIETIDRSITAVLVKAPLYQLSNVLATQAKATHKDVIGSELNLSRYFTFAFQFKNHRWSVLTYPEGIRPDWMHATTMPSPAQLSKVLEQPVIKATTSDPGSSITYQLFENGEMIEYFAGIEGGDLQSPQYSEQQLPVEHYVLPKPYGEDPADEQQAIFGSHRRKVTAVEIKNIWGFAFDTLYDLGAYLPSITATYFTNAPSHSNGGPYRVKNLGEVLSCGGKDITAIPDFLRVDYFRFEPSPLDSRHQS